MLNQSVVGATFVSILQTLYLANGSQHSRKTGNFWGILAKAFRKRSAVLTRVDIRSLEVIKGQTVKIEVLCKSLSVIMRRRGKMDQRLV